MMARTHHKRINLMVRRNWFSQTAPDFSRPGVRISVTLAGLALLGAGLFEGYQAGRKAASSFCQVSRSENALKADAPRMALKQPESGVSPVQKDLEARMRRIPGVVALEREKHSDALQVVLESDAFFRTGTASLEQKSELTARKIASMLRGFLSRTVVEIQGHTDDSPVVRQRNLYRSNWELSLARAASMLHVFEEAGFVKTKLKVVGYGDSRPLVPNRTRTGVAIEENLSKNRRIVLRILPEGKTEAN
jgi:flagellar motor protein MotB